MYFKSLKEECDNYIKMFLKINDDTFRLCATNALNPKCRFYQKKVIIIFCVLKL